LLAFFLMIPAFSFRARLIALSAVPAVFFVSATVGQAAGSPTPSQLVRTAMSDATARGSVHEVSTEPISGGKEVQADDVTQNSGRQTITGPGGLQARVLLVDKVGYMSGNEKGLVDYFGFPSDVASAVGEHWISVSSTGAAYGSVAEDATLGSALKLITPAGSLKELGPSRVDGMNVIGIHGSVPRAVSHSGTETLYITRSAKPLPVEVIYTLSHDGKTVRVPTTLSKWGERATVTAPTTAIPLGEL
jgi:hypothetical protein